MRSLSLFSLAALVFCLGLLSSTVVEGAPGEFARIRSLARFFEVVLDKDHDGFMSQKEYKHQLEGMDPVSYPHLPLAWTNPRHNELDLDGDKQVSVEELCLSLEVCSKEETEPEMFQYILASNLTAPIQIHLAAGSTFDHMYVNWAQNITDTSNAIVKYGTVSGTYTASSPASWKTYTVSLLGFTYTSLPLFNATMTFLEPNTRYFYVVGSEQDGFSNEFSFVTFPDPTIPAVKQITTRMVTYGDQGTAIPMGTTVCKWVEAEHAQSPFGMLLHLGDLAYAGVSHKMGEYEPTWDAWMEQIAPIASVMPYMTSVGNHEDFFNFASYDARFQMPGNELTVGGNASFYFSFDQGTIHVTSFSTESPYAPGSVQYEWMEADMAKARANPNTKWLILSGHRPLYSSDNDEWKDHQPGCPLLVALEGLINKYAVDLVLTGHEHMYERSWPVFNGTVVNNTVAGACSGERDHELGLINDKESFWSQVDETVPLQVFNRDAAEVAPIYIVQATAGVFQFDKVVEPQPVWSNFRLVGTWGYGVLSVSTTSSGCSTLLYQFKTVANGAVTVVDQMALIRQVTDKQQLEEENKVQEF